MRALTTVGLALSLAAPIAIAGTPFGGDDTGFVPPDQAAYKCGRKVLAGLAKLRGAITSCHKKMAESRLRGSSATDDGCETAAKAKFDATLQRLFSTTSCPACLVSATAGLSDAVEADLDASNGEFYCAGIDPFGGDDTGFVPINILYFKCSSRAAQSIAKYGRCITVCHQRMAAYALGGRSFDEEACEATCLQKYNTARDQFVPLCGPCLQMAELDQLAADTETALDQSLGTYFCASPNGAFIDPAR